MTDGKGTLPGIGIPEQDFCVHIVPSPWREQIQMTAEPAVFFEQSHCQAAAAFQIGIVAAESFYLFGEGDPVVEQQCLIRQSGITGIGKFKIGTEKSSGTAAEPGSPPGISCKDPDRHCKNSDNDDPSP